MLCLRDFTSGGRHGELSFEERLRPHLTEEHIDVDGADVCIRSDDADREQVRTGLAKELPLRHRGRIANAGWRLDGSCLILQPGGAPEDQERCEHPAYC